MRYLCVLNYLAGVQGHDPSRMTGAGKSFTASALEIAVGMERLSSLHPLRLLRWLSTLAKRQPKLRES